MLVLIVLVVWTQQHRQGNILDEMRNKLACLCVQVAAEGHVMTDTLHSLLSPISVLCTPLLLLQASSSGDGTPSHADSSCLVIAAGEPNPAAAAAAAPGDGTPGDPASLSISVGGPLLKPPIASSSPMALAKGPLTASRPANRRPGGPAAAAGGPLGGHPLCLQSTESAVLSPGAGAGRMLSFGLGDVGQSSDVRPQRQPGDFFARMFGCFTPRVAGEAV
jgi:hypothetical protein